MNRDKERKKEMKMKSNPSPEWKAAVVFWRRRLVDNQIWASLAAIRTEDVQFFETLRFNHLLQ